MSTINATSTGLESKLGLHSEWQSSNRDMALPPKYKNYFQIKREENVRVRFCEEYCTADTDPCNYHKH